MQQEAIPNGDSDGSAPPQTFAHPGSAFRFSPVRASVEACDPDPALLLARSLGPGPFALVLIFAAEATDLPALLHRAHETLPAAEIAGCTTAGELCEEGYSDGRIVAVGFPAAGFAAETVLIDPVDAVDSRVVVSQLQRARLSLQRRAGDFAHELGILLVDGLSGSEEHLIASLAGGLGPVPVVGGSAGDGRKYQRTRVFAGGGLHDRAAVLCLLRTRATLRTFSFDCTRPSRTQMVVTSADPENRAILRINDEPAALEYARLLSIPAESLGSEVFATRPVLVRAGGRHHVRSIQHVGPDNSLVFFGAVAEGMVLTLAEESDIAAHLDASLQSLCGPPVGGATGAGGAEGDAVNGEAADAEGGTGDPALVMAFDCLFRRIDAESRQKAGAVSQILRRHRVAGFSTYGEQIGSMHVNQTFTGVAFYSDGGTAP